jgi:linoleoyl-CoA desaturase
MLGSANISGSKLMHIMTGNLSHQIEHHCFPDLPSNRYHEVAVEVREICERYGLPYTTGPLPKQVYQAWAKVFRLALPNRPRPLPKNAAHAVNAPVPPRRPALPMVARVG